MIHNIIVHLPVDQLVFSREARQRTDLTLLSVLDLAITIGERQWISPILVEKESNTLVAGERRTTAVRLLHMASTQTLPESFCKATSAEDLTRLTQAAVCHQKAWENWTKIPAQLATNLTPIDLLVFEFIENKERLDLPWQDKAKAVYEIHAKCLSEAPGRWNATSTANLIGLSVSHTSQFLKVWRATLSDDAKLKAVVDDSPTARAAAAALDRISSRKQEPLQLGIKPRIVSKVKTQEQLSTLGESFVSDEPPPPAKSLGESLVLQQDFHDFARSYEDQPFNFLHLDFPYGIEFNKSGGQSTAVDTRQAGEYDDNEEVYWQLLDTLATYQTELIAPSAHVMLWYSQNLEDETKEFFRNRFPRAVVQKFKLIWHCSNNSGIVPDPQRYGRRTYETAFSLSFGDRKIVAPKALSFAYPRENEEHRSQKPLAVLTHFFGMFVDESSRMADFTCGSATSVIATHQLGAQSVLGLEREEETYQRAVKHVNRVLKTT